MISEKEVPADWVFVSYGTVGAAIRRPLGWLAVATYRKPDGSMIVVRV